MLKKERMAEYTTNMFNFKGLFKKTIYSLVEVELISSAVSALESLTKSEKAKTLSLIMTFVEKTTIEITLMDIQMVNSKSKSL